MRLLHTADWHMNEHLGRVDRSEDICKALEQVAGYLDEYGVDVMLVAGDLFSERSSQDKLRRAVGEIKRLFMPFLERGGTIVAATGNHDDEIFFETLRTAFDLVSPVRRRADGTNPTGRLHLFPRAGMLRLPDSSGRVVQFVLMPYPTIRCYVHGENIAYQTIEERRRGVQHGYRTHLEQIKTQLDHQVPSVLVSHIYVRGAQIHSTYKLTEKEDVVFEQGDIPHYFAYAAYGHIHKPQCVIEGARHIRYSGSVERLDAGEKGDEKSVVLIDIGKSGRADEIEPLPLKSTPIYDVEIRDPETELAHLAQRYPEPDRALVRYKLHWKPGSHNREELCNAIHRIFPRWYERDFSIIGEGQAVRDKQPYSPKNIDDVLGTVREYLRTHLGSHQDRDEILALSEALMAEGDWQ